MYIVEVLNISTFEKTYHKVEYETKEQAREFLKLVQVLSENGCNAQYNYEYLTEDILLVSYIKCDLYCLTNFIYKIIEK